MPKGTPNDLTGKRIGRRVVLGRDMTVPHGHCERVKWLCKCDCGSVKSVFAGNLSGKKIGQSCGCQRDEALTKRNTKHGIYGTPAYWNWLSNRKRAMRLRATPAWADEEKIRAIYESRPEGCDVDHIVPLVSKFVCGLHCEANLQYLPSSENQSKKNRYWPDMPEAT